MPVFRQFGTYRKHHFQEEGADVEEPPECHVQEKVMEQSTWNQE